MRAGERQEEKVRRRSLVNAFKHMRHTHPLERGQLETVRRATLGAVHVVSKCKNNFQQLLRQIVNGKSDHIDRYKDTWIHRHTVTRHKENVRERSVSERRDRDRDSDSDRARESERR